MRTAITVIGGVVVIYRATAIRFGDAFDGKILSA
jgi:hypothetical protein